MRISLRVAVGWRSWDQGRWNRAPRGDVGASTGLTADILTPPRPRTPVGSRNDAWKPLARLVQKGHTIQSLGANRAKRTPAGGRGSLRLEGATYCGAGTATPGWTWVCCWPPSGAAAASLVQRSWNTTMPSCVYSLLRQVQGPGFATTTGRDT